VSIFSTFGELPAPVARYLRYALTDGQGLIHTARLRQSGTLRTRMEQHAAARRASSAMDYRETVAEMLEQLKWVLADQANADAFELDSISRERMNAEFNLASLDAAAAPLPDAAFLSLTAFRAPKLEGGTILVNGVQVRVDPVSQTIIAALADRTWLRFDELKNRLENVPRDALHRAVLDLARHDVVTIQL
jgi:hypothetical protein